MSVGHPGRVLRFGALSIALGGVYLVLTGLVAAIIPNPIFARMTPVTASNFAFWVLPAVLVGALAASYLMPLAPEACDVGSRAVGGGVLSFLAAGCPLCNKVVVLALGTSGALSYFEPIQPLLGLASLALLGYALWLRLGRAPHALSTAS